MEISEYEETYKQMFRPLLSFCGQKYFGIDNESVVQQAFLALWNKKRQINDNKKFLFTAVDNIAKTAVRSRIRLMERQNAFLSLNDYTYMISEKELFLDKLSLQGAEESLFDMVFVRQLKQSDVAKKLKTTENNINVKVFRLKNKILQMYQRSLDEKQNKE